MAVLVLVVVQDDGTESDFLGVGVGSSPVDVDGGGEVIEICLAQSVGPPQARILYCGGHLDAVHPFLESHSPDRNLLAVGCDCEISSRNIAVGNHLAHQGEVGAAVSHVVLDYLYIGQTRAVPCLEHHGAPDARSHQTGTPVPAVVIACLAGEDAHEFVEYASVLRLVRPGVESVVVLVAFGEVDLDGRMEIDFQFVFARFELVLYVDAPCAVHIVGVEQRRAVEIDVGIGVESVENQFAIVGSQFSLGGNKRCLIHPVFFVHPLHSALVEAEKRVLDDLVGHEVGVNGAGHGGRIPDFGTSLPELPSVVNVALRHGRIRGRCKHHCGQCR